MKFIRNRFTRLALALSVTAVLIGGSAAVASAQTAGAAAKCSSDYRKNPAGASLKMCKLLREIRANAKSQDISITRFRCRRDESGSAHQEGNACDVHFATKAGGDHVAEWLRTEGDKWGMKYLIWYGAWAYPDEKWDTGRGGARCSYPRSKLASLKKLKKSSPSRYREQWTTCHYDHIHASVDGNR